MPLSLQYAVSRSQSINADGSTDSANFRASFTNEKFEEIKQTCEYHVFQKMFGCSVTEFCDKSYDSGVADAVVEYNQEVVLPHNARVDVRSDNVRTEVSGGIARGKFTGLPLLVLVLQCRQAWPIRPPLRVVAFGQRPRHLPLSLSPLWFRLNL